MTDNSNINGLFQLNPSDPTPLYAQLDGAIRLGISIGRLPPDTQLPTVRQLAVDLSVNLNTVPKIAIVVDQLHHSFTKLSVGEADFHALGCAPRA